MHWAVAVKNPDGTVDQGCDAPPPAHTATAALEER